jgi:predicted glycosyltransferase
MSKETKPFRDLTQHRSMSTTDWETMHGLQSMGEHYDVVSIYGADLEDNRLAEKLKQAFVEFPIEILTLAQIGHR